LFRKDLENRRFELERLLATEHQQGLALPAPIQFQADAGYVNKGTGHHG
jgi:hypothetical protein